LKLLAHDRTVLAVEEFRSLLRRHGSGSAVGIPSSTQAAAAWRDLVEGDWPLLGVRASESGFDCDLRDLVDFAEVWGEYLFPLPFIFTLLAQRWGVTSGHSADKMWTFPIAGRDGRTRIPFGHLAGVRCWLGRSGRSDGNAEIKYSISDIDDFAPSLPVVFNDHVSSCDRDIQREAAVLGLSETVGVASVALRRSIDYAKRREAFGRPIGQFQAVKHILADMHRDLELSRTLVVMSCDPGVAYGPAVELGQQLTRRIVECSIQVHGGIGFTWDAGLHFLLRHIIAIDRLIGPSSQSDVELPAPQSLTTGV
jgi:Acyl-CoA dehydrogenase, C-terminal domain